MWKEDKYHGPGILLDESSFDVAMYNNGEKIVSWPRPSAKVPACRM